MRRSVGVASCALLLAACGGGDPVTGATEGETESGGGSETTGVSTQTTSMSTAGSTSGTATGSGTGSVDDTGSSEPYCGDGSVDPNEECDDGNDDPFDGCLDDCTEAELIDPPQLEWTYFEVEGTTCLDGSTAGFGISYNPDSTHVMVYLEGGGACFNDACEFTAFSIPFVPPTDGIFDRNNDANPVRDWTMIYVPYCTGDIHAGDAETELGGAVRYFHGYSNITRYLQTWVPSFDTDRVLLTGISAGGFGAALNATQVAEAYGDDVELTVIDDSGPPLSNTVIAPCLQEIFRQTWNLDGTALATCPNCDPNDFATDLLAHTITTHPAIRFGLFSNTADQVIRTYMGFGWGAGEHDNCEGTPLPVPIQVYADDLDDIRATNLDAISTFYITGVGHTALRVGFNITYADGTSLPEWIGDVLDGNVTHLGP